jgi:hypothetical protein
MPFVEGFNFTSAHLPKRRKIKDQRKTGHKVKTAEPMVGVE